MKKITLLILVFSFTTTLIAQISVRGIVTNDSIPLEFASVIIKNSTKGIATNSKGEFKLEAKKGDTLSVSYLGYETKNIVVNKNKNLKVKLEAGGHLEEVVVIAYGVREVSCCKGRCYYEIESEGSKLGSIQPQLYPNPSSNGIFQLKLTEDYNEVKISVANISGRIIQNTRHQKFGEKLTIDLSQFSTGIYIVNIVADGKKLEAIKAIRS